MDFILQAVLWDFLGLQTQRQNGHIVHKSLSAPGLEDCVAGRNTHCSTDAKIPDEAFLRNAEVNLREGARQLEVFRNLQVPPILAAIKAALLASLEHSLEEQQARYTYLKSGDLAAMRAILCGVCNCGNQESAVMEQLRTTTDPHTRLHLSWYDWHNKVVACEHAHEPAPYPLDQWQQFLKNYGVVEKRRTIQID